MNFRKNAFGAIALLLVATSVGLGACSDLSASDGAVTSTDPMAEAPMAQPSTQPLAQSSTQSLESFQVVSFRSPTCGCCAGWVEHMRGQGFQVEDHVVEDIEAVKREHNVPTDLASCHTAIVDGYIIEGHIPATDVSRLLAEQPDVAGIAVPGMPIGSPGMESGNIQQPYTVYTFTASGMVEVFQEHSF